MNDGANAQEIIIVKRSGEGEDGHHGGAWKIAFADFMTAMMALFLVLWLINAANEETKRSVASYFNPIKLVERNRSEKGLQENEGGPATGDNTGQEGKADLPHVAGNTPVETMSEDAFFADPVRSLEVIAGPPDVTDFPAVAVPEPFSRDSGAPTDGFVDPLAAEYWAPSGNWEQDGSRASGEAGASGQETGANREEGGEAAGLSASPDGKDKAAGPAPQADSGREGETGADVGKAPQEEMADAVAAVSETIREALEKALGPASGQLYRLEVQPQDGGVMISLTDQLGFPMFEIGSAVPREPLVRAMDAVSRVLSGQPGKVRIFGHTDGRPIRAENDDNWRLSMDRARAAFFMLKRAGFAETRISQITGFADRKLRVPEDPYDDSNRRIELLLEIEQ
ncbi:MotB family protein [Zhengella sp. ZM62]|uniref:MotB family protein n=1 Tax=Zhengella sedimenti TaxID=3390035 RepID=UPI0039760AF1